MCVKYNGPEISISIFPQRDRYFRFPHKSSHFTPCRRPLFYRSRIRTRHFYTVIPNSNYYSPSSQIVVETFEHDSFCTQSYRRSIIVTTNAKTCELSLSFVPFCYLISVSTQLVCTNIYVCMYVCIYCPILSPPDALCLGTYINVLPKSKTC